MGPNAKSGFNEQAFEAGYQAAKADLAKAAMAKGK
jgi:hypothetical protein